MGSLLEITTKVDAKPRLVLSSLVQDRFTINVPPKIPRSDGPVRSPKLSSALDVINILSMDAIQRLNRSEYADVFDGKYVWAQVRKDEEHIR